jgi:hypothetical protein
VSPASHAYSPSRPPAGAPGFFIFLSQGTSSTHVVLTPLSCKLPCTHASHQYRGPAPSPFNNFFLFLLSCRPLPCVLGLVPFLCPPRVSSRSPAFSNSASFPFLLLRCLCCSFLFLLLPYPPFKCSFRSGSTPGKERGINLKTNGALHRSCRHLIKRRSLFPIYSTPAPSPLFFSYSLIHMIFSPLLLNSSSSPIQQVKTRIFPVNQPSNRRYVPSSVSSICLVLFLCLPTCVTIRATASPPGQFYDGRCGYGIRQTCISYPLALAPKRASFQITGSFHSLARHAPYVFVYFAAFAAYAIQSPTSACGPRSSVFTFYPSLLGFWGMMCFCFFFVYLFHPELSCLLFRAFCPFFRCFRCVCTQHSHAAFASYLPTRIA